MKVLLRTKQDGRIKVMNEAGELVDGVRAVKMTADAENQFPKVTLEFVRAGIAVDANAEEGPATDNQDLVRWRARMDEAETQSAQYQIELARAVALNDRTETILNRLEAFLDRGEAKRK